MRKKIRFIINPISGVGKQKNIVRQIEKHLDRDAFDYEISYTEYAGHATLLSKEAAEKNYYLVVVVGGDGSVHEVGKGLLHSNTALGIIPTGSGNGFANHCKIPHAIPAALKLINTGKIISIDTLMIQDDVCINCAGIGFDAHIAHLFAGIQKRGFFTYCKLIRKEFSDYVPQSYELHINDKVLKREAFVITFANGSQFGNNAHIAPTADTQDGYMDVCIMKSFSWLQIPITIYHLFNKTFHKLKMVEIIKTKSIVLKNNTNEIAHIDGEAKILREEIKVTVNPLSLRVLVAAYMGRNKGNSNPEKSRH